MLAESNGLLSCENIMGAIVVGFIVVGSIVIWSIVVDDCSNEIVDELGIDVVVDDSKENGNGVHTTKLTICKLRQIC